MHSCMMARNKRSRRRWNPNNSVVRLQNDSPMGALASLTALINNLVPASESAYRAISLRLSWAMNEFTAGDGPVYVGVAHGDYTAAEVEEWIESQTSMNRGDKIANERRTRQIRMIGVFDPAITSVLNDGKPITTKLNWAIPIGQLINMWAYNADASAPLTTGSEVSQIGSIFLRYT